MRSPSTSWFGQDDKSARFKTMLDAKTGDSKALASSFSASGQSVTLRIGVTP